MLLLQVPLVLLQQEVGRQLGRVSEWLDAAVEVAGVAVVLESYLPSL